MFEWLKSFYSDAATAEAEQNKRIEKLESIINTSIEKPSLYIRALRHRSILADEKYSPSDSYERLEFLGDAVLDLIVTEIIFQEYPGEDEGFLTKLRAKIVKGDALAKYAEKLDLSEILVVGERAKGQGIEFSKSVLADVFESLIGAIYLDKGYRVVFEFVRGIILEYVDFQRIINTLDNHKSLLLEFAQANKMTIPEYKVVGEEGPGHDKTFEIAVLIEGKEMGRGRGKSKKEAEQIAARLALEKLESSGD